MVKDITDRIRETLEEDYTVNSFSPTHGMHDGRVVYVGHIVDKNPPNYQQLYIPFKEYPEYSSANDRRILKYNKK